MAASANPSGGNQDGNATTANGGGGRSVPNGNPNSNSGGGGGKGGKLPSNPSAVDANLATVDAMKHCPGLADHWSPEEQAILDQGLAKFASYVPHVRYTKIQQLLKNKSTRDIALRCRWMNKKESGKRRKDDLTRKSKDKKEKIADPSAKASAHLAMRPNVPPYTPPMLPLDNDDGISNKAIGGPTGHLLEQNAQVLDQINANFATNMKIHDNISLFCQTRDNILAIMNDLNDTPGVMKQMPPLPVKLNEELLNSILPRTPHQMQ